MIVFTEKLFVVVIVFQYLGSSKTDDSGPSIQNTTTEHTEHKETEGQKIPSAHGLPVRKGLHRHVVMITKKLKQQKPGYHPSESVTPGQNNDETGKYYTMLGCGNVLNVYWVLTSILTIKDQSGPSDLFIVPGLQNQLDQSLYPKIRVADIVKFKLNETGGHKYPEYKSLALIKVLTSMVFGSELSDVFLNFEEREQEPRNYGHCELVGYYYIHDTQLLVKTQFPVKLVRKTETCTAVDTTEICVEMLLVSSKYLFNPCFESSMNLGASIMCDVALEAIFYGYENGTGCDSLSQRGPRAVLLRSYEPTKDWLDDTLNDIQAVPESAVQPDQSYLPLPTPTNNDNNDNNVNNDNNEPMKPLPVAAVSIDDYYDAEIAEYDRRFDFKQFQDVPFFFKLFKNQPVYPEENRAPKRRKCSRGDRWGSHFIFVTLITLFCKCFI